MYVAMLCNCGRKIDLNGRSVTAPQVAMSLFSLSLWRITHPGSDMKLLIWQLAVTKYFISSATLKELSFIFVLQACATLTLTGFLSLDKFLQALSFPPSPKMLSRRDFGADLSVELWCCCSAFWMLWEETTARRNRNEAILFILVNKNNVMWRPFDTSNQNEWDTRSAITSQQTLCAWRKRTHTSAKIALWLVNGSAQDIYCLKLKLEETWSVISLQNYF